MRKGVRNLTRAERLEIGILLQKGYSLRSIAEVIGRSPNTISYEVRRNSVNGKYRSRKADTKARVRKKYRRFQWSKIEENPSLKRVLILKLQEHWNPDEIAGWLKRHGAEGVSKTAIYDWLRSARGERFCVHLYSQRRRVRHRKRKTARVLIPNRVGIEERYAGATNRSRYGHWEVDTVMSKKGTKGGVKTAYERKSRLFMAMKVLSMRPREHVKVERVMFTHVHARSVTRDNGIENRNHEALSIPSYFANPYHSWEKGGVENGNKMLRRYFPKRTNFMRVSPQQLARAVHLINKKPRKILGYRSAYEVAIAAGIIKNKSVLTEG
jgi:transposase, IS30 family